MVDPTARNIVDAPIASREALLIQAAQGDPAAARRLADHDRRAAELDRRRDDERRALPPGPYPR